MKAVQVVVQPKRVVCSAKFGVSISPTKQYLATKDKYHRNMYKVEVRNGLLLTVSAKDLEIVANYDKRELLDQAMEDATEAIVEKASKEAANRSSLDSAEEILYLRDDMDVAWRAVQAVEASKNVHQVLRALTRYIGCNEANKIVKV